MGINPYSINGGQLYQQTLNVENPPPEVFEGHIGDTPTWLMFIESLTHLSLKTAYWVFTASSFLFLATSLALLSHESQLGPPEVWLVASLMILYPPIAPTFWHGKGDLQLLFLFVLIGRFLTRGSDTLAGITLGFAGALRGYPFGLCAYLVACRRWRALAAALVSAFVLLGVTTLVVGRNVTFTYFAQTSLLKNGGGLLTDVAPLLQPIGWAHHPSNLNLGWFVKFAFDHVFGTGVGPMRQLMRGVCAVLGEVILVAAAFLATNGATKDRDAIWRHLSLWIVTITMISPLFWSDFLDCFVVFFVILAGALSRRRAPLAAVWIAVAAYISAVISAIVRTPRVTEFLRANLLPQHLHVFNQFAELLFLSVVLTWISAYWFVRASAMPSPVPARTRRGEEPSVDFSALARDAFRG